MQKVAGKYIFIIRILNTLFPLKVSNEIFDPLLGERYVYKFMCEPEILFSMGTPQPTDLLNTDYVPKLRDDSWSEYSPSYTSEIMTLYNNVQFSRYFGYKEEQSQDSKMTGSEFFMYPARSSANSLDLVSSSCSCRECMVEKPSVETSTMGYEYSNRNNYHNTIIGKETYIIRSN